MLAISRMIRVSYRISSILQQQMAQQVLTQFQEHQDAWTRVPDILERSSFPQTKVCRDCLYPAFQAYVALCSTLDSKSSRN